MVPGERNSQRMTSNTQLGWKIHMEASNTQHKPGPVEDAIEEKEMIPGGWNRQREANNNQQDTASVEGTLEEKMFHGGMMELAY